MDEKRGVQETPSVPKPSAIEVLNVFMKDKGIQLVFGDMKIRQIKDGAIIIEKPPISAEYV